MGQGRDLLLKGCFEERGSSSLLLYLEGVLSGNRVHDEDELAGVLGGIFVLNAE